MHPHRQEVEAALLANIYNPHFDQVVIFLDREFVKGSEVCHHFRIKMKNLSLRLFRMTEDEADKFLRSKLTCVDVYSGQPTYYQMFKNAVSDYVTGDIVVMANADQAFDETMAYARHLHPEVLAAIGTRGYTDLISADTDYYYKSTTLIHQTKKQEEHQIIAFTPPTLWIHGSSTRASSRRHSDQNPSNDVTGVVK